MPDGKIILDDASITVDGVDLSDHGNHVEITSEKEERDVTGFGASSREIALGLGDGSIAITFLQDFAAGSVDATLWPIHSNKSAVVVVIKPTSSAVAANNPSYTMTGVIPSYSPLNGDVGAESTIDVTFRNAAQAGIVRAVA